MISTAIVTALNYHAISCLHVNAGEYRPVASSDRTDWRRIDEGAASALALASAPVDDAAQRPEELRHPVDFVEDDKPILGVG